MSHLLKLIDAQGGAIRFIQGSQQGRECWFYLQVDPLKFNDYKKAVKQPSTRVGQYGKVLESGWGKQPSPAIIQYMLDEYAFETVL